MYFSFLLFYQRALLVPGLFGLLHTVWWFGSEMSFDDFAVSANMTANLDFYQQYETQKEIACEQLALQLNSSLKCLDAQFAAQDYGEVVIAVMIVLRGLRRRGGG